MNEEKILLMLLGSNLEQFINDLPNRYQKKYAKLDYKNSFKKILSSAKDKMKIYEFLLKKEGVGVEIPKRYVEIIRNKESTSKVKVIRVLYLFAQNNQEELIYKSNFLKSEFLSEVLFNIKRKQSGKENNMSIVEDGEKINDVTIIEEYSGSVVKTKKQFFFNEFNLRVERVLPSFLCNHR